MFGDSYCDVGNIFVATAGTLLGAPYYNGRFSNGPLWVDHVAGFLRVPLTPSLTGGTDFAFGGAWVTVPRVTPSGVIPSGPQQVSLYLAAVNGVADRNGLYIVEGGGNDILGSPTAEPETLGAQIALKYCAKRLGSPQSRSETHRRSRTSRCRPAPGSSSESRGRV